MRTLLLALMIALLPIRGWVGDAMAVEMAIEMVQASPTLPTATAMAATPSSGTTDAHCHEAMDTGDGMSMADADPGAAHGSDHDAGHQDCNTCSACQVCHTVALGGMPRFDSAHAAPQAVPAARPARFASAEPAPGLKPPIS